MAECMTEGPPKSPTVQEGVTVRTEAPAVLSNIKRGLPRGNTDLIECNGSFGKPMDSVDKAGQSSSMEVFIASQQNVTIRKPATEAMCASDTLVAHDHPLSTTVPSLSLDKKPTEKNNDMTWWEKRKTQAGAADKEVKTLDRWILSNGHVLTK